VRGDRGGDAEVAQLDAAAVATRQQHVARLDVPVQDLALGVEVVEAAGDGGGDDGELVFAQRRARTAEQVGDGAAVAELHRDPERAALGQAAEVADYPL